MFRPLVPVVVVVGGSRVITLAMLDGGSTKDIISSQLVRELSIPTTKREIHHYKCLENNQWYIT